MPTSSPETTPGASCPFPKASSSRGTRIRPTYACRPISTGCRPSRASWQDVVGARCLVSVGDSVTTDHISPAGSIKPDSPAGRYLIENGVERRAFNSYGSRRGNHEVMVRGTFANVRLRNLLVPGSEGTWTVHLPSGEEGTIYDTAERYRAEGVPLIVLAGKEYGSGSSRDWAAKGPKLLGVRAVIAESYERIHRSNLLMMGILPLQFLPGESLLASLGLTGREEFSITGRRERRGTRGDGSSGREGVSGDPAAGHAARARVPTPRRDPSLRAAAPARVLTTPRSQAVRSSTAAASLDDDERRRRPGERDVELAQALSADRLLDDQRGLDDDHVVELHALRLPRREDGDARVVEERGSLARIAAERGGGDHRQQALGTGQPRSFLVGGRER